jgi:DNA-binding IclR family transcriptional regulator
MDRASGDTPLYHNQSIGRAFAILACFSLLTPTRTLNDICAATSLPKPTVFRLLAVLEAARFVARTPDKQSYQIGARAFELGSLFLSNLSIERLARPVMEQVSKQLEMACNLGILDDGQVLYVAITDPRAPLLQRQIIGHRHYVHCSALGKVLIAPLPEADVRAMLRKHGMPGRSPYTLTDPDALLADLQQVCRRGYALDDQEGGAGMRCLGAPIYDHTGNVAAAMSISAPSPLLNDSIVPRVVAILQDATNSISIQLGWNAPERQHVSEIVSHVNSGLAPPLPVL